MKKSLNKKPTKCEPWFKCLMRKMNSFDAFQDFALGKNPEAVASSIESVGGKAYIIGKEEGTKILSK